jgi:hypothetical protein
VAAALGRGEAEVTAALRGLAHAGWVRRNRDGRWRSSGPLDLRLPSLDDADDNDRSRVAAYLESKFDRERHLLTWAARHREDFGSWGKGERASAHLTQAELDRFNAEYHELVTRYCLLRPAPASGTREIAVRFYAFPAPTGPAPDPELTTRGEAPGVSPAGG